MTVHSTVLLGVYGLVAFLASLGGGRLPSLVRLTHTRLQTALSFIAGLMLGMAFHSLIDGLALAWLGLGSVAEVNRELLGCALGFCAGGFLCIAGSDLLPELHFHAHDRLRLSLALLAGLGIAVLVGAVEGHSHSHGHDHGDIRPHSHRHTNPTTP